MSATEKSLQALREHAAQRSAQTTTAVEKALRDLRKKGAPINIQSVARHAGVTRATIYRRQDLRQQITADRDHSPQRHRNPQPHVPASATEESAIIASLRHQISKRDTLIAELNSQVHQLNRTIETLHGQLDAHLN